MRPRHIEEIAAITGGQLLQQGKLSSLSQVNTDTRALRPGDFFACLQGPHFDGHVFMQQAVAAGACGVLAQVEKPARWPRHAHFVRVSDTLLALMALAGAERRDFAGPVVGVTGSHGKTTAKEWLRHLLSPHFVLLTNPKNHNNELGVTQTWLSATPATEVAVIEMGMRGLGQIRLLCGISQPTVGVITAVGSAHAGELGGVENVANAKAELLESLPPEGVAVFPSQVQNRTLLEKAAQSRLALVGEGTDLWVSGATLLAEGGTVFTLHHGGWTEKLRLRQWALGQLDNLLLALRVCLELGLTLEEVTPEIETFAGVAERVALLAAGRHRLINDAYNASPESMAEALRIVAALPGGGRRLLLLGDMLELGDESESYHRGLAPLVLAASPQAVFLAGPNMAALAEELFQSGYDGVLLHEEKATALVKPLVNLLKTGDPALVLIKSSHGVGLHALVDEIKEQAA